MRQESASAGIHIGFQDSDNLLEFRQLLGIRVCDAVAIPTGEVVEENAAVHAAHCQILAIFVPCGAVDRATCLMCGKGETVKLRRVSRV